MRVCAYSTIRACERACVYAFIWIPTLSGMLRIAGYCIAIIIISAGLSVCVLLCVRVCARMLACTWLDTCPLCHVAHRGILHHSHHHLSLLHASSPAHRQTRRHKRRRQTNQNSLLFVVHERCMHVRTPEDFRKNSTQTPDTRHDRWQKDDAITARRDLRTPSLNINITHLVPVQ